jgi:hypothetical protein
LLIPSVKQSFVAAAISGSLKLKHHRRRHRIAPDFSGEEGMATRSTKKRTEADETTERALAAPLSAAELHARITARAHEVFLERNGAPGDELSDWLTAEREVCGSLLSIAPAPDEEVPVTTTAPKRKRTTTATTSTTGSSTKSSTKSSGKTSASAPRLRKRKTADE